MNETLKEREKREKLLSSRTKKKSHWSSGERKRWRFEHLTAAAQRREKEREREREKREREKREERGSSWATAAKEEEEEEDKGEITETPPLSIASAAATPKYAGRRSSVLANKRRGKVVVEVFTEIAIAIAISISTLAAFSLRFPTTAFVAKNRGYSQV